MARKLKSMSVGAPIAFTYLGETHTYETVPITQDFLETFKDRRKEHMPATALVRIDGKPLHESTVFIQMKALLHFMQEIKAFLAEMGEIDSG